MAEVERQRGLRPHPYMVETFVARDEPEVCLTISRPKPFCAQNGAVREARIELAFARLRGRIAGGVPPQGPAGIRRGGQKYVRLIQQLLNTSLIRRAKRVL